jgi:hypothetical protein
MAEPDIIRKNQVRLNDSQDITEMPHNSIRRRPIQKDDVDAKQNHQFLHLCVHKEFSPPPMKFLLLYSNRQSNKAIVSDQHVFVAIKKVILSRVRTE